MEPTGDSGIDRQTLRQAFVEVYDGFSPDRVVADPTINEQFIAACRSLGLDAPATDLNRALLNLRKAGALSGIKATRRTTFQDQEDYAYAAEIAIRLLELSDELSLDDVICDPTLAERFDELCQQIAPGQTSLEYRWAALNLRKTRKLRPELIPRILRPESGQRFRASDITSEAIPNQQGIYIFMDSSQSETLYVGESSNLRQRVAKHLDHSDNRSLARWMWDNGLDDLWVEIHVLPEGTNTAARRAFETELIQSRNPRFNVQGR